ncbi:MAG: methylmalonyl Co-A mutase-associated GTPase MeaB [Alphaproteobacteria bacterium]|jgi:LAO/AO transport system kinase|nr:methylmalonyl Co-A mutase-associated GTPase MeaB [Alphaproteobacteria bacterium]PPR14544.1 MAG: putative GTPase [Alphaproteobacteria bacterium MarineAlpha12_Bin1]|tara:strand:- start:7771 stop:8754 length:984 start_codon:yes stop_codon:yes gene_type:complete
MTQSDTNLIKLIREGDRRALAQAITLIESVRDDHREQAENLIEGLLPFTGKSMRIAVSGVPGVGKSTFIEAFGKHIISLGKKVAVLAVDPSSKISGGSILGDKTRMDGLSQQSEAFIRPTPTSGEQGGVARRTRESILVCEAAGYDVVMVETVGVGQSETVVSEMVDMFFLMLLPGSGDELQGIKRGIVELADLIIVNKADGDLVSAAKSVASDYSSAVRLLQSSHAQWVTPVVTCSSIEEKGINDIWDIVIQFRNSLSEDNLFDKRRIQQALSSMRRELDDLIFHDFHSSEAVKSVITVMEGKVESGLKSPAQAARELLSVFKRES